SPPASEAPGVESDELEDLVRNLPALADLALGHEPQPVDERVGLVTRLESDRREDGTSAELFGPVGATVEVDEDASTVVGFDQHTNIEGDLAVGGDREPIGTA